MTTSIKEVWLPSERCPLTPAFAELTILFEPQVILLLPASQLACVPDPSA
jgi:hypothetical protein